MSVQGQTHLPCEIVVVDDGSEPAVNAKDFDTSEVPLRVVRHEVARGVAAARNAGVRNSEGELIAFLDDDDTWTSRKLELAIACFVTHPDTDVAVHQIRYEFAESNNHAWRTVDDSLARMLYRQPPSLDTTVVRRVLHEESPMDEQFPGSEDVDYLIRLAKSGARFRETGAVLAICGSDQLSTIGTDARIQGRLKLLSRHPEIRQDRTALAFFNMRLGHQYRRNGQRWASLASFGRSLFAKPSASAARGAVLCLMPANMQYRLTR